MIRKALLYTSVFCLLAGHTWAAPPFSTNDTWTLDRLKVKGDVTIEVIKGCTASNSNNNSNSGGGSSTTSSTVEVFSGVFDKAKDIGPFKVSMAESDCIHIKLLPSDYGSYQISPVRLIKDSDGSSIVVTSLSVEGDLEELMSRDSSRLSSVMKEITIDPDVCAHPEWFEKLPEDCDKIKNALSGGDPVFELQLPVFKLKEGALSISTGGDTLLSASDSNGKFKITALLDKISGISFAFPDFANGMWTVKSFESQSIIVNGNTYQLAGGGLVSGRFQGWTQEFTAVQDDYSLTFNFAKDDKVTLWATLPDGTMVSWGERSWNTRPSIPAVPFNVKAGSVTLTKPIDTGYQRLLSAGKYGLAFLSGGAIYKAEYSMKDSFGNESFSNVTLKRPYEISQEENADKNYVTLVAQYFPQLEHAGTIGDKCYLVPAGTSDQPGLSIYRVGENVAYTYFILAAFCEEGASVPEVNRVVVSLKTPTGDAVLDLVKFTANGLTIFWNKRVWMVGEEFSYAILMGAQGDEAEIVAGDYTIAPPTGSAEPTVGFEPAGFVRRYVIDNNSPIMMVNFSYTVTPKNGYSGSFRGYLFVDSDADNKYDDIRQMVGEVKDGKTILSISVPFVPEEKEKKVSYTVAMYDDKGEMIPSFPDGRTKFTMTIPPKGQRAIAPMVYAQRNKDSVKIGLSLAYGDALEFNDIKAYLGVVKYGRGVVYVSGIGPDAPTTSEKLPIHLDAFSYRDGELYAEINIPNVKLDDFWGFRFIGDYLAVFEVENESSYGGGSVSLQEVADFHIR